MVDQKPKILCVDDEPNLLASLSRQLRDRFEVATAVGGTEGLKIFEEKGPFPVVVSDLRMPGMDGVALLGRIRQVNPDTVRILLTGQADLNSAISAVNEGHIFRFLTKPCPPEILLKSLQAAQEQYNLITSEKVLLEQTLQGSIQTLIDVLSLASPHIFSRTRRMGLHLKDFLPDLEIKDKWPIEVAAMLSQIGVITLPDDTVKKLGSKEADLRPDEQEMVCQLPSIGAKILSHIPRLEPVREILLYQEKHFDGSGYPEDNKKGELIPLGARVLKVLLDYEKLEAQGYDTTYIFDTMYGRKGWYDQTILKRFATFAGDTNRNAEMRELPVFALQQGMVLEADIFSKKGTLLVRRGLEITVPLLARIHNIAKQTGIKEPIRVKVPTVKNPAADTKTSLQNEKNS